MPEISDIIAGTYKPPEEWRTLDSYAPDRKVGGEMGKHDFLMLLSAQLKYQDPLEPMSDSDFAAQLAQFSALEQMQNMNETLAAMANYQAYSLVGKLVVATAYVDGQLTELFGTVECVYTEKGVTYAQVGDYSVPISAITDVYDNSNSLTPQMLVETSNSLIDRYVRAEVDKKEIEGTVTGVFVHDGNLWARIKDADGIVHGVQIGCIYDIGQPKPVEEPKDEEDLLKEAEDMYVGQEVVAKIDDEYLEGIVAGIEEDDGVLYALIIDSAGDEFKIPVDDIELIQAQP